MCEPISMAAALSTALQVTQLAGQAQAYNANAANAAAAMRTQNAQTNLKTVQDEAANSQKAQDQQIEMLKAAATAIASANENGVTGNSVDALIGDYHASEGRYLQSLTTQNQWNRTQGEVEKQGQSISAQNQINSVAKPDYIGAALRIGGDTLNAYNQKQRLNNGRGT